MRFFILLLMLFNQTLYAADLPLHLLKLLPGFKVEIFAEHVPNARQMALGSKDIVFVGSIRPGKVYAIVPDANSPYKTKVITIASALNMPNGVAFHNGSLYVAAVDKIYRYDNIEQHLSTPPKPVLVTDNLPDKFHHGWRYMRIGPDNKIYIGIGAPCNVCLSKDPRFATIMRMNLDGTHPEIYAKGIRNTVGFDWHPTLPGLWFTENGRDRMGDDTPPDELDYAPKIGMNFGFPFCHGNDINDPEFGKGISCNKFTKPILALQPHAADLGMKFYTGKMFPAEYQGQIFIAEHGSWDRSKKVGYRVIAVKLNNTKVKSVNPFITGWLQDESEWGRPVDVLILRDGSMLISDDAADVIYRVSYI